MTTYDIVGFCANKNRTLSNFMLRMAKPLSCKRRHVRHNLANRVLGRALNQNTRGKSGILRARNVVPNTVTVREQELYCPRD